MGPPSPTVNNIAAIATLMLVLVRVFISVSPLPFGRHAAFPGGFHFRMS
jgi:hypothetical protein